MPWLRLMVPGVLATCCACAATTPVPAALGPGATRTAPAQPAPRQTWSEVESRRAARPGPSWRKGEVLLQGFVGADYLYEIDRSGGPTPPTNGDDALAPVLGGGGQWKLGGESVDVGLEAMFSVAFAANVRAFAAGGGGAAIVVDVDMFLLDLFGGPFVSRWVGQRTRLYAAAGPMMQFVQWNQSASGNDQSGSGFGVGGYARAGAEYAITPSTLLGIGARWSRSTVDLSGDLGNLDLGSLQTVVTVTQGF